ncbi:UBX domain-containing protein 6 isoform X1 [Acipenser ruthenus]|uniref:UBX domain-containing protein 6-like isoform X1 n=2 Tax=Acipenser ruthenus TaxID=7906 RepID=UPI00145B83D5|nr:UBX domain-containing protein 6-like isoform X1 [Acipenser ruthenus]XP_058876597.1 UBX domain-containing protein 6 isoform X1 [Acipenser ruthenus]
MKKFFQDIKKDVKFKSAGPGKKLTDESSSKPPVSKASAPPKPRHVPTEGAQMAAAAALSRVDQQPKLRPPSSQQAIRNQVKRELLAEAAAVVDLKQDGSSEAQPSGSRVPVKEDPASLSVSGVYFTCPLTGATLTKGEREAHIKEAVLMKFAEDPVEASVMMVHTFNKDREKVKAATEVIAKYIDNICKNPTEEKYRKIRLQNKIFQERVSCLEGTQEFLQSIGFENQRLPVPGQEDCEDVLVLSEEAVSRLQALQESRDRLLGAEPLKARLHRQSQVYKPSPQASRFELPPDFYSLTAEELKREQQLRSDAVERNAMLRTKAMRERDEQREMRKYNYTLLRIRLPDGNLLQGTFFARERVSALYEFVRDSLLNGWQPFLLIAPGSQRLTDESLAFNECGLVPAALLTLSWDAAVQADIEAAGAQNADVLKPELMSSIQTLS